MFAAVCSFNQMSLYFGKTGGDRLNDWCEPFVHDRCNSPSLLLITFVI